MSYTEFKNLNEFESFITTYSGLMVIDFYASWCGPCKIMSPIFEKLSNEIILQEIAFAKIDRDQNQEIVKKIQL